MRRNSFELFGLHFRRGRSNYGRGPMAWFVLYGTNWSCAFEAPLAYVVRHPVEFLRAICRVNSESKRSA